MINLNAEQKFLPIIRKITENKGYQTARSRRNI